jgi:hypothetical protein
MAGVYHHTWQSSFLNGWYWCHIFCVMFQISNPKSRYEKNLGESKMVSTRPVWPYIRLREEMAHTCNPSYLRGRDQEDRSSKPAWANSLGHPMSKNPITTNWAVEWPRWRPWVQAPRTTKKKSVLVLHLQLPFSGIRTEVPNLGSGPSIIWNSHVSSNKGGI